MMLDGRVLSVRSGARRLRRWPWGLRNKRPGEAPTDQREVMTAERNTIGVYYLTMNSFFSLRRRNNEFIELTN